MAFSIPTFDIHAKPKYYNGADGAASGYRAVWVKHTSGTTAVSTAGGRLVLTPAATLSGPKSWEWWTAWRLWIDPAWDPALQGNWGTTHNWHTSNQDVGGPCGPIGWSWPGDGVSSFFYSYMGGNMYRGGLNGVQTAFLFSNLTKGVWHSLLTQVILGRTDGTVTTSGHPNGGKGRVRLWMDGNDTPYDSGDVDTIRRARCTADGIWYNQTAYAYWDGFYTKNCTQDCHLRITISRFGKTLSECLADNTIAFHNAEVSNILDPNGIGPNLGPSFYAALPSQLDTDFVVPPSLGGSTPPPPTGLPHTGRWTTAVQWNAAGATPPSVSEQHLGPWTTAVGWSATEAARTGGTRTTAVLRIVDPASRVTPTGGGGGGI